METKDEGRKTNETGAPSPKDPEAASVTSDIGSIRQDTVVNNARLINLMGALFNFNICESTQLQEAMVACYNDKEICDKTDSCTFVKDKVEEILQSSGLRLKNESYSISIGKGDNPKFLLDECNNIGILVSTTIIDSNRDHYNSYFRTC